MQLLMQELFFDDYIGKYHLDELKRDLAKANYYLTLVDGNTGKYKKLLYFVPNRCCAKIEILKCCKR